jgi:hypothetical protein
MISSNVQEVETQKRYKVILHKIEEKKGDHVLGTVEEDDYVDLNIPEDRLQ